MNYLVNKLSLPGYRSALFLRFYV